MKTELKLASLILAVSTMTLSACGSADDENSLTSAFNEGFEESWETEFVGGCVSEAVKVGAPEADSKEMCECVSGELLGKLDGITEKVNPPKEKMDAALKACGIPGT